MPTEWSTDYAAQDELRAERAAIMEFDGGLTREDAEAKALAIHPQDPNWWLRF